MQLTITAASFEELRQKLTEITQSLHIPPPQTAPLTIPEVANRDKVKKMKNKKEGPPLANGQDGESAVIVDEPKPTTQADSIPLYPNTPIDPRPVGIPEPPQAPEEAAKVTTLDEVKEALKVVGSTKGLGFPIAQTIVQKHGAERISELKPEKYKAVIAACQKTLEVHKASA